MKDRQSFLMIGQTGQGKSSTGNSILQLNYFKTSNQTNIVTEKVTNKFVEFEGRTIYVVDGPGWGDPNMTSDGEKIAAAENMGIALSMCYGEISAFLYVLKGGNRFTASDENMLQDLKRIFGPTYMKHMIIIISGGDIFREPGQEGCLDGIFKNWCQEQGGKFRELCENCSDRILLFNNRETDQERRLGQVRKLVQMTQNLTNNVGSYTSQCFKDAKREREKLILEINEPQMTRKIQETVSLLTAKLAQLVSQPSESEKKEIRERIQNLKNEIENKDDGHGVLENMRKLAKDLEENLHDVEELHKISMKLEETRQSKTFWTKLKVICAVVGGVVTIAIASTGIGLLAVGLEIAALSCAGVSGGVSILNARALIGTRAKCKELEFEEKQISLQEEKKKKQLI